MQRWWLFYSHCFLLWKKYFMVREEGEANTERRGDCGMYPTGKPWGGNLSQTTDIVSPLRGQGTSWSCPWSWTKATPLLTAIFVYPRTLGVSNQLPQCSQVSWVFSNIIFLSLILPSCCKNRSQRKESGYFQPNSVYYSSNSHMHQLLW